MNDPLTHSNPPGSNALRQSAARCPRCGYDQRGIVATWIDSCPMRGRCAECGLDFSWPEVLHPEKYEPQWCVEFARTRLAVPWLCVKTYVRSFWPWGFWKRVPMSHAVRAWRLTVYAIAMLLPLLFIYAAVQGTVAGKVCWQMNKQARMMQQSIGPQITALQNQLQTLKSNHERLEPRQYAQLLIAYNNQFATWQKMQAGVVTKSYSDVDVVIDAILRPLGQFPKGTFGSMPWGSGAVPAPNEMWEAAFDSYSAFGISPTGTHMPFVPIWLAQGVAIVLLYPLLLGLMPLSIRKAKVRIAHIARVAVYSLFIIPTWLGIEAALIIKALFTYDSSSGSLATPSIWIHHVAQWGPPILLVLWWGAAIGRYMKIPFGIIHALLLMIIAVLLGLAGIWSIAPGVLVN